MKMMNELYTVVGRGAAEALMQAWGGTRLYVPKPDNLKLNHPIVLRIGSYQAERLANRYGGTRLEVPCYSSHLKALRNKEVVNQYEGGIKIEAIALNYGISARGVKNIIAAHRKKQAAVAIPPEQKNEKQVKPGNQNKQGQAA